MAAYESDGSKSLPYTNDDLSLESLYNTHHTRQPMFDELATPPQQVIENIFNVPDTHTVAFNLQGITDLHLLYCKKDVTPDNESLAVRDDENQRTEQGLHDILSKLHGIAPGSTFLVIEQYDGHTDDNCTPNPKQIIRINHDYYVELQTALEHGLDELGWEVGANKRHLKNLYTSPAMTETEKKLPYLDIGVFRPDGSVERSFYMPHDTTQSLDAFHPLRQQSLLDLIGHFEYDQPTRERYGRFLTDKSEMWDLAAGRDPDAMECVNEMLSSTAWWSYMLEAAENPILRENYLSETKDTQYSFLLNSEDGFPQTVFEDMAGNSLYEWILETSHLTIGSICKIAYALSYPPSERLNMVKDVQAEEKIRFHTLPTEVTMLMERTAMYMLAPEHTIPLLMRAIQYNRHVNKECPYYKNRVEVGARARYWWSPHHPVRILPDSEEQALSLNVEDWLLEDMSIADRWRQAYAIMDEIKKIGMVPDTEEEGVKRTILRDMCRILGYPVPDASLKFAKNKLINAVGCTRMPKELASYHMFNPEEYGQIRAHAESAIMKGRKIILRLFEDSGEKGGGYPIALITSDDDLEKITDTDGAIDIETDTHGSMFVNVFPFVQSVSRLRSIVHSVHEADKRHSQNLHNITDKIGLGGGGRLQLDGLRVEDGKLMCDFSAILMYNEATARETSLMSERARKAPRVELSFSAAYDNGVLVPEPFPVSLDDALAQHDLMTFSRHLLGSLFKQDGAAYAKLFGALIFANQQLGMHSVELAFATIPVPTADDRVQDDQAVKVFIETIDFDGVDTLPKWLKDNTVAMTQVARMARSYEVGRIRMLTEHWMNDLFELRHTAALAKYNAHLQQ